MKKYYAAIPIIIFLFFLFKPKLYIELFCEISNTTCMNKFYNLRDNCINSLTKILFKKNKSFMLFEIMIRTDIFGRCEIVEKLINMSDYYVIDVGNMSINISRKSMENFKSVCTLENDFLVCNSSIFETILEGFERSKRSKKNIYFCGLNEKCKGEVIRRISNCIDSEIEDYSNFTIKGTESSFWTKYINIKRSDNTCRIYVKVLNAINLPPEIPPTIVGMDMICIYPIDKLPITELNKDMCTGELKNYIYAF